MFKKQILKMKHGKKMICTGIISAMLLMAMSTTAFASAQDTPYDYFTGPNGFATQTRLKEDYTSSYINHQGVNPANVQVRSSGINYSANGGSYYVGVGQSRYLPNYVKENGRNNCYLYLTPSPALSCTLFGQWSPDSV